MRTSWLGRQGACMSPPIVDFGACKQSRYRPACLQGVWGGHIPTRSAGHHALCHLFVCQVVCTEAIGAGVTPVAREALQQLHERLCAAGAEHAAAGDEASVLRCLIRLTTGACMPHSQMHAAGSVTSMALSSLGAVGAMAGEPPVLLRGQQASRQPK